MDKVVEFLAFAKGVPTTKGEALSSAIANFYDDANVIMLKEHSMVPPRQGLLWDAVKHRWTSPEKVGKTVTETQGSKRIRGSGTGAHERSVGGHGSGGTGRETQKGRKFRGQADAAVADPTKSARRKKVDASKKAKSEDKKRKGKKRKGSG